MMSFSQVLTALTDSLSSEAGVAAGLLSLLAEESAVLVGNDHSALLALTHRKHVLAERLAQGEVERRRRLRELGLPEEMDALEKLLLTAGAEDALAACQNLRKTARACAERNRKNGILVETRLRHTERALEIITGRPFEVETYGARPGSYGYGQRTRMGQRSSSGRSLARA